LYLLVAKNQNDMNSELTGETRQLSRNLAKLKHEGLAGIDYAKAKIFKMCETDDCGSYICNLSTRAIIEVHGFTGMLSNSDSPLNTVENLHRLTHPEDRKKIHEVLEALCELGKDKRIYSEDRLSITYRIKFQDRYIQVNRKSGLVMENSTGEVFNWSNIYAMPTLKPIDHILYRWTGKNITHKNLITHLMQKREKIFTRKELEIVTLLLEEMNTSQMTDFLCISPETLKKHLSNMLKKSGTSNRRQLLRYLERSLKN
jgi:DNA-binding CsgD family transcriptional regulator